MYLSFSREDNSSVHICNEFKKKNKKKTLWCFSQNPCMHFFFSFIYLIYVCIHEYVCLFTDLISLGFWLKSVFFFPLYQLIKFELDRHAMHFAKCPTHGWALLEQLDLGLLIHTFSFSLLILQLLSPSLLALSKCKEMSPTS